MSWRTAPATTSPWSSGGFMSGYLAAYFSARYAQVRVTLSVCSNSPAAKAGLDADSLLRLEHAIIAHQRLAEWGSPKPPMTPEAMIIHYADDLDAKFDMIYSALRDDKTPGPLTSDKNLLRHRIYRGMEIGE